MPEINFINSFSEAVINLTSFISGEYQLAL